MKWLSIKLYKIVSVCDFMKQCMPYDWNHQLIYYRVHWTHALICVNIGIEFFHFHCKTWFISLTLPALQNLNKSITIVNWTAQVFQGRDYNLIAFICIFNNDAYGEYERCEWVFMVSYELWICCWDARLQSTKCMHYWK